MENDDDDDDDDEEEEEEEEEEKKEEKEEEKEKEESHGIGRLWCANQTESSTLRDRRGRMHSYKPPALGQILQECINYTSIYTASPHFFLTHCIIQPIELRYSM